jgi:hypothetical protein
MALRKEITGYRPVRHDELIEQGDEYKNIYGSNKFELVQGSVGHTPTNWMAKWGKGLEFRRPLYDYFEDDNGKTYRHLRADEKIERDDQYKKPTYGNWSTVVVSVGDTPSKWPSLSFRREFISTTSAIDANGLIAHNLKCSADALLAKANESVGMVHDLEFKVKVRDQQIADLQAEIVVLKEKLRRSELVEYREPTDDDHGKMIEVRDHDTGNWQWAKFFGIAQESINGTGKFAGQVGRNAVNRYRFARITV